MKKFLVLCLVAFITILSVSCIQQEEVFYEKFSVKAGEEALVDFPAFALPKTATEIKLPKGIYPKTYLSEGFFTISKEKDADSGLGVLSPDGKIVVPLEYDRIQMDGPFIMASKQEGDGVENYFYYKDGEEIPLSVTELELVFYALDDNFFCISNDTESQVFDKKGRASFVQNFPSTTTYSAFDDYIQVYDPTTQYNGIYEVYNGFARHIKSYIGNVSGGIVYNITYSGKDTFIVLQTSINGSDFDYVMKNEETGNLDKYGQRVFLYDGKKYEEKEIDLDFHILSIRNMFSPGLTYENRKSFAIKEGFSNIWIVKTDENKNLVDTTAHIMDSKCRITLNFEGDVGGDMLRFANGVGFGGASLENFQTGLFALDGSLLWSNNDFSYHTQSYNDGFLVVGKGGTEGVFYGVFDKEGQLIIPLEYDFISNFADGCALARKNGGWIRLFSNGDVENFDYHNAKLDNLSYFTYLYTLEGKVGVENFKGERIIPCEYDEALCYGYSNYTLYYALIKGEECSLFVVK